MRTRFAPSPTGSLHIGGLRTALFAWLLAKQTQGAFVLRIEDTDRAREVVGATEEIVRVLAWAGLTPDEGVVFNASGALTQTGAYGPYRQSERLAIYRSHVDRLLAEGHAYPCFCSAERLEQMRRIQQERRQAPMYDGACRALPKEEVDRRTAAGERHVVRLRVPREETIAFDDEIYGPLSFKGHTVDDQVLLKSDGFPTYHLAHVVDDRLMAIDCVIRGEEWLPSTPKHLLLWRMLGWAPPRYAHVPLLLNKDRSKLSKRQNDTAAEAYVRKGYLPEALPNFLALLGWNPGTTAELFSLPELVREFSLARVQKSGAIFDLEKLDWLQGQWMRRMPMTDFAERIRPLVAARFPAAAADPRFPGKAALIRERILFFADAPEMLRFFYAPPSPTMDLVASPKQKLDPEQVPGILTMLEEALGAVRAWDHPSIVAALDAAVASSGLKKGQLLWPLRAMLTGQPFSPGAYEVAHVLGKEETLRRLRCRIS